MRLDPKYFNVVVGVAGAIAIVLIGFFTVNYFFGQQSDFKEKVADGNEFREIVFETIENDRDSVSVAEFAGQPVIVDFWATWSSRSQHPHEQFADLQSEYPDLVIISALVKDDPAEIIPYREEYGLDFIFVEGTDVYQEYLVPGIPAYLFFDSNGEIVDVVVGFRGIDDFDKFISYLEEI